MLLEDYFRTMFQSADFLKRVILGLIILAVIWGAAGYVKTHQRAALAEKANETIVQELERTRIEAIEYEEQMIENQKNQDKIEKEFEPVHKELDRLISRSVVLDTVDISSTPEPTTKAKVQKTKPKKEIKKPSKPITKTAMAKLDRKFQNNKPSKAEQNPFKKEPPVESPPLEILMAWSAYCKTVPNVSQCASKG